MRLTTKSEYSLLALIYIARNGKNRMVKVDEICGFYTIPKKYLEQLLSAMKRSGYVQTKRGAGGGYKLAKPASRIRIADIIRLMDGALAPTVSVSVYFHAATPLSREKKVMEIFQDIRDYVSRRLEKLKLSDLV
jgi:Rrf2 family cysteine metabolism transcriptional repressor